MGVHRRFDRDEQQRFRAAIKRLLVWAAFGEGALLLVLQPYRPVLVVGDSMLPTLSDLQLVIAKPIAEPHRGDVVVFDWCNETVVKRVAGLANDSGLPGMEPWMRVPSGQVYVLGDNPSESADSRVFGPIQESDVKLLVVFPETSRHM